MQEQEHVGYIISISRHCRLCHEAHFSYAFLCPGHPFHIDCVYCKIIKWLCNHITNYILTLWMNSKGFLALLWRNRKMTEKAELKWHLSLVGCLVSWFKAATMWISVVLTRKAYTHTHTLWIRYTTTFLFTYVHTCTNYKYEAKAQPAWLDGGEKKYLHEDVCACKTSKSLLILSFSTLNQLHYQKTVVP